MSAGVATAAPTPSKTPPPPKPATPTTGPTTTPPADPPPAPAEPPEEPPKDMNGTDENPDAPKGTEDNTKIVAPPPKTSAKNGYPSEEWLRPITLPQNMSEVSISPHFEAKDDARAGYAGGDALHARYGITRRVQIGLTYVFAAIYHDPTKANAATNDGGPLGIHSGKAVGLDLTVLVTNWVAVRVAVPVYISPVAVSLTLGAPLKFQLFDNLAIGGMEDFINIKLDRFAPSFYQEYDNALAAFETGPGGNNTSQPSGYLKFSGFVDYQLDPKVAFIGRFGIISALSSGGGGAAGTDTPQAGETFLRGGVQWTPRPWVDLGASIGFDDLAHAGTFGPQGFLALRI